MSEEKMRYGDWMETYTGKKFWPLDPYPEEIDIVDVARALSMMCRFNGHCSRFYSVAEHSVNVCDIVEEEEHKLAALLHDTPEGYIQDIISPVKPYISGYKAIETNLEIAVAIRFGLHVDAFKHPVVKRADNAALLREAEVLVKSGGKGWRLSEYAEPAKFEVRCLSPDEAMDLFLDRFNTWSNR